MCFVYKVTPIIVSNSVHVEQPYKCTKKQKFRAYSTGHTALMLSKRYFYINPLGADAD